MVTRQLTTLQKIATLLMALGTSNNIANAETTRTPEGGPYKRQLAHFELNPDTGGVNVSEIVEDTDNFQTVYQPGHPDATPEGYVTLPNVNVVEEMVDLVEASRMYEANITALNASKAMTAKALEIGRG